MSVSDYLEGIFSGRLKARALTQEENTFLNVATVILFGLAMLGSWFTNDLSPLVTAVKIVATIQRCKSLLDLETKEKINGHVAFF